jgi:hypothetical protein
MGLTTNFHFKIGGFLKLLKGPLIEVKKKVYIEAIIIIEKWD